MAVIRQPKINKAPHAVSGAAQDPVRLSRCIFKNQFERKSLTVHHVQRRLSELGYAGVISDKDGFYGDATALAVADFQAVCGFPVSGQMDAATFERLFAGDINVVVSLD